MVASHKLTIPCDRAERLHYIRKLFPAAKGVALSDCLTFLLMRVDSIWPRLKICILARLWAGQWIVE